MNSRDLGADLVLAWPEAALGIRSVDEIVEPSDTRKRLACGLATLLGVRA